MGPYKTEPADWVTESGTELKLRSLRGLIHDFLNRGKNGACLTIRPSSTEHEIVFWKYITKKGEYGLNIIYDNQDRRNDHTNSIKRYCVQENLDFQISSEKESAFCKTISIECGRSVDASYAMLSYIVKDVVEIPIDQKFDISSSGLSPWKEIIVSPDQMPLPNDVGVKVTGDWIRQSSGTDGVGLIVYALLRFLQVIGVIGTLIMIVVARDSWNIGSPWGSEPMAEPPLLGMVFVIFSLIGLLVVFTPTFWRIPTGDRAKGMLPVPKTPYRMLRHFFGQPINWATIGTLVFAAYAWG